MLRAATLAANGGLMLPTPCRVESVTRETHDTVTLSVPPPAPSPDPLFSPGQFSMLYVYAIGEVPISISGDPKDSSRLVYTVRSVGAASHAITSLRPGDSLGVRGPFGSSWPLDLARGRDVLLVAGGIGLAPLRPAIHHILHHRDDYQHVAVLYGARTPKDLLFRKQWNAWARLPGSHFLSTVDFGGPLWRGRVGVVTTLFRHVRFHPSNTVVFTCGPEIMMHYVLAELTQNHAIPPSRIFLSLERNMKCAVGFCGHCQFGPHFVCKDGPVFPYSQVREFLESHEL